MNLSDGARGYIFNGDMVLVIQALDMGTRPSNLRERESWMHGMYIDVFHTQKAGNAASHLSLCFVLSRIASFRSS
jgi:hypothetical protein